MANVEATTPATAVSPAVTASVPTAAAQSAQTAAPAQQSTAQQAVDQAYAQPSAAQTTAVEQSAAQQIINTTPGSTASQTEAVQVNTPSGTSTGQAYATAKAVPQAVEAPAPQAQPDLQANRTTAAKPATATPATTPKAKTATTTTTKKATTTTTKKAVVAPVVKKVATTEEISKEVIDNNPYWDALGNMKFDYDPEKDTEYQHSAKVLENQIMQMMVGRGALYSSLGQAALSTKLIELQIGMRKEKYAEFQNERNFTLSMAQTVFSRQDAAWQKDMQNKEFARQVANDAWNQKFQTMQFKASREDAAFEKSMARANLALSRASAARAAASQQMEIDSANSAKQLSTMVATYQVDKTTYNDALAELSRNKSINLNLARKLGIPDVKLQDLSYVTRFMGQKLKDLESTKSNIVSIATKYKQSSYIQASYYDFITPEEPAKEAAPVQYTHTKKVIDPITGNSRTVTWKDTTPE